MGFVHLVVAGGGAYSPVFQEGGAQSGAGALGWSDWPDQEVGTLRSGPSFDLTCGPICGYVSISCTLVSLLTKSLGAGAGKERNEVEIRGLFFRNIGLPRAQRAASGLKGLWSTLLCLPALVGTGH